MNDSFACAVARVAGELPDSTFIAIVGILENGPELTVVSFRWKLNRAAFGANAKSLLDRLIDRWGEREEITAAGLALALRSARASGHRETATSLVWTGPISVEVPARRTDQILLEMMNEATSELLIVTFAVHEEGRWIKAISSAIERGVKTTFVVETAASGKVSKDGLKAIDTKIMSKIDVLTWDLAKRPLDARGTFGTLHAKCAVADRRYALISSANLTEFAMIMNMEIGITLNEGPIPGQIAMLFDDLRQRGHLVKVN